MKLIYTLNKIIKLKVLLLFFFNSSLVISAENIENDLKEITSKLRCMTCQNQTIYDSDADFSKDLKKVIHQKLNNGESNEQIIEFIEERYGEYILFEPKFDKKNIFLWTFPFIILCLSVVFLLIKINKNKVSK